MGRAGAPVHRRLQAGNTDVSTGREAGAGKTATPTRTGVGPARSDMPYRCLAAG